MICVISACFKYYLCWKIWLFI